MLQRIQSVYLFIVTVLTALMTFLPLGGFMTGSERISLKMCGFVYNPTSLNSIVSADAFAPAADVLEEVSNAAAEPISSAWGLVITIIAATILPLVTIFLYKKRMLQFRLCIVEMILLCGIVLFEAFYLWLGYRNLSDFNLTAFFVPIAAIFPVFSLIFTWLAQRGIKKDILLLKSMDRIR